MSKILTLQENEWLRIFPTKVKPWGKLPELEAELKAPLTSWHAVKAELLREKLETPQFANASQGKAG